VALYFTSCEPQEISSAFIGTQSNGNGVANGDGVAKDSQRAAAFYLGVYDGGYAVGCSQISASYAGHIGGILDGVTCLFQH
jgi:hypothetical protein